MLKNNPPLKAVGPAPLSYGVISTTKTLQSGNKEGINNWVAEADHASEKPSSKGNTIDFPDHFILSEESGETATASEIKWIIDRSTVPSIMRAVYPSALSASAWKNGEMILGAVYNPFINELFLAEKGMGSFLNDKRIRVSRKKK